MQENIFQFSFFEPEKSLPLAVREYFEPHSELIQRGRREKPIEFGHKIVISQSREKFITAYQVLEEKMDDRSLLESVVQQQRSILSIFDKFKRDFGIGNCYFNPFNENPHLCPNLTFSLFTVAGRIPSDESM
jgi:hypothetical protein